MDFKKLTPYDFEYLVEDILIKKGFNITSRPALGPDQGRDMIAERLVTDDMRITTHEIYLVQCKHFLNKKQNSVKERDIPNFITKVKKHEANRYLLVTSANVSETVKDLFQTENRDNTSGIKCSFFSKQDLMDYIMPFPDLVLKYFEYPKRSILDKADEILKYIYTHQFQVHRGAMLYDERTSVVFGNDGYRSQERQMSIRIFRAFLKSQSITELAYKKSEGGTSWVLLVDYADAKLLHDKIWELHPGNEQWKINEQNEAYSRLWTHWQKPLKF